MVVLLRAQVKSLPPLGSSSALQEDKEFIYLGKAMLVQRGD